MQNERITDLQRLAELDITKEQIDLFDQLQSIYSKQDRISEARLVFRISMGLLIGGLVAIFISLFVSVYYNQVWGYVGTTMLALMEGILSWGFKQILMHYYPVIKDNSQNKNE